MYDEGYTEQVGDVQVTVTGQPRGLLNFKVKDSGVKAHHSDGVQRDSAEDKPTFGLMFPAGVPFEDQLLTRVAMLYMRGAKKYGDRNWEKVSSEDTLEHNRESFLRHAIKFYMGVEDGEDHAAATVWNVNAVLLGRRRLDDDIEEELEPVKEYVFPYLAGMADRLAGKFTRHSVMARSYTEARAAFDAWFAEWEVPLDLARQRMTGNPELVTCEGITDDEAGYGPE
jgi:hypothetical protein